MVKHTCDIYFEVSIALRSDTAVLDIWFVMFWDNKVVSSSAFKMIKNSFWSWDHHIVTNHHCHQLLRCSSIKISSSTSWKCSLSFTLILVPQVHVVSLEDTGQPVVRDNFCSFLPHVSYVVTKPLEPNTPWHIVTSQRMDALSTPSQTLKNMQVFFFLINCLRSCYISVIFFKLKKCQSM
jgi:hypothetical protein